MIPDELLAPAISPPSRGGRPGGCLLERTGHPGYLKLLDEIRELHAVKSGGYGNSADPLANFTAIAAVTGQPRHVYPVHRAIEKLSRCVSLIAQGRDDELGEEFLDVASLLLCAEAMRREMDGR